MKVTCPKCKSAYDCGPEYFGKQFTCKCGELVTVPEATNTPQRPQRPQRPAIPTGTKNETTNPEKGVTVQKGNVENRKPTTPEKPKSEATVTGKDSPAKTQVTVPATPKKYRTVYGLVATIFFAFGMMSMFFSAIIFVFALIGLANSLNSNQGDFLSALASLGVTGGLLGGSLTTFCFCTVAAAICRIADIIINRSGYKLYF